MAENSLPQESDNPQKALKVALDYLESLAKGNDNKLKENLYSSFSAISFLLIEAKKAKFQDGWAIKLKDSEGMPLFNNEEADLVERLSKNAKPLFEEQTTVSEESDQSGQVGGALSLVPGTSKAGMLQELATAASAFDTSQISLDKTFWKIRNFLKGLDKQSHDLSRELGPFKFFYESANDIPVPIPIPFPLVSPPFVTIITIKIPPRIIPLVIEIFVESIRLIMGVGPQSNDLARKILSVVMAVIDLMKGNWKHGLLSFAGYFGQYPLIAGLIGKAFLNVFSFIAPDIQDALIFDIFRSGKSIFIGFYLWAFTVFAPDIIRARVREAFENPEYLSVVEKIKGTVGSKGYSINPTDVFIVTFDDIQNLQSIARQPAVMCSADFQKAITGLAAILPVRLFLEMINIPCDPETVDLVCGPFNGLPLEKTIGSALGLPQGLPEGLPQGLPEGLPQGLPEVPGVPFYESRLSSFQV